MVASQEVDLARDGFEVFRIDAQPHPAEMINLCPVGDQTLVQPV